jgi:hypothetical protein
MKPAVRFCMLFLLSAATADAQLSLRPEIGFDRSQTSIRQNELPSLDLQGEGALSASLRLDYRFKGGHGPYTAIGTSPSPVQYNFTSPSTAMSTFNTATSSLRFRFETGYQYTSKAISLGGKSSKASASKSSAPAATTEAKKTCGSYTYRSQCGSKKVQPAPQPAQPLNMRIIPSVGVAFHPDADRDIKSGNGSYQYNAGAFRTALVSGMGFEFGRGKQRLGTMSVYYSRGLGDAMSDDLVITDNGKTSVTHFTSSQSSWAVRFGIPFTLAKKAKSTKSSSGSSKKSCGSYSSSSRCTRKI